LNEFLVVRRAARDPEYAGATMDQMDQFIDVGDIRLRYRIEGEGDWLVLVHGVGGSLEQWDQFVDLLGGCFRTLRYDQRGHGRSSKPEGPYSLDDFVNDLDGLLTGLGVERCHLAGCSLGGLVAQGYALAHQDRLDRLVLLAAIAGRTEAEKALVMERLAFVANGIPRAAFRELGGSLVYR
jgi:(E)-2-((N-methylformamido)methylene)succinate hydrolase